MAEFLIGVHCSVKDCNTLDFLPLKCDKCEQIFCKNHLFYACHDCPKFDYKVKDEGTAENSSNEIIKHICSYKNCSNKEFTKIICPLCGLNFCLQHRHDVDHDCPNIPKSIDKLENTKKCIKEIISESTKKPVPINNVSQKNASTMNMINLMKLKQKSTGDLKIPATDRFYFKLINQTDKIVSTTEFFVDKKWTVGKVLDFITLTNKIENRNNISCGKKFLLELGNETLELQTNICDLQILNNGCTLILKFE